MINFSLCHCFSKLLTSSKSLHHGTEAAEKEFSSRDSSTFSGKTLVSSDSSFFHVSLVQFS